MQPKPDKKVLRFRPRPGDLMRTIRALAKTSEKVFFGKHARSRMSLRGISDEDALRVLALGEIKGEITPGDNVGEWQCKVSARLKGNREIGVVTITSNMRELFVVTVEWEDP